MLIDFNVENYRSLRDQQMLSMVAAASVKEHESTHVFQGPAGLRLLRTALIFGPNASGKSNVIDAIDTLRWLLTTARGFDATDSLVPMQPFRLDARAREKPCTFGVTFAAGGIRYEYKLSASTSAITQEELGYFPEDTRRLLFRRSGSQFSIGPDLRTKTALNVTSLAERRPNVPFLSLLGQFEEPRAVEAYRWFADSLRTTTSPRISDDFTKELLINDPVARSFVLDVLRLGDLGIREVTAERELMDVHETLLAWMKEIGVTNDTGRIERARALFRHSPGENAEEVFEEKDESAGTLQFLALAGPLYDVFRNGRVLAIDELDSSLHPDLVSAIVGLFNAPSFNRHGAQLVANTHDVTQLEAGTLRRDNVWFTEKARDGASNLYALTDIGGVRKDTALRKNYLQGRFGALPALGFSLLKLPSESDAETL